MGVPTATVTAYYGNNFDINNIPANPTVLASASQTVTVGVINCLPFSGKAAASIVIKAFANLKETSYFKIHFDTDNFDWYAAVNGYEYTSIDTVRVDLVIDAWLTCGGTTGITDVSGLTRRHSCLDDTFGKYTQPDPLIIPSETLKLSEITKLFTGTDYTSEDGYVIVESTVNLWKMGMQSAAYNAITYEDINSNQVTVPQVEPVTLSEEALIFASNSVGVPKKVESPCVGYFNGKDDTVKRGISICRSLGVENGILAQYVIPKDYVDTIEYDVTETGRITKLSGAFTAIDNYVNADLAYEYAQVNNNRVLYGENNKYILNAIATGNKIESSPEEVYNPNIPHPGVYAMVDPRSKGLPYFRFTMMYGSYLDIEVNSIAGLEWQSAPINYQEKSGAGISKEIFSATQERESAQYEINKMQKYVGHAANVANLLEGGAITSGLRATMDVTMDREFNDPMFYASRALEKAQFEIKNTLVAPELNFPRAEGLRDIVGNGVYLYRYMYTSNDIARIDKILNMYGYADVKPLELTDFTDMKYYNYVEADATIVTSVQVTRKIREMCQNQISAGVRVWKINPNFALYAQSNREVTP